MQKAAVTHEFPHLTPRATRLPDVSLRPLLALNVTRRDPEVLLRCRYWLQQERILTIKRGFKNRPLVTRQREERHPHPTHKSKVENLPNSAPSSMPSLG